MLTLSIVKSWHTHQIDFTLAYPQANVECDLYMELPNGFGVSQDNGQYCLQSIKSIHGQKQAGRTWVIHFKSVYSIGFVQSLAGNCMFFQCSNISVVYVDDVIIMGPQKGDIDACIQDVKGIFNHTDKGNFSNYLGIKVTKLIDGHISLSQPHLIDAIIADLKFAKNTKANIPAVSALSCSKIFMGKHSRSTGNSARLLGNLIFLRNQLNQTLPMPFIHAPASQQRLTNHMPSLSRRLLGLSLGSKTKALFWI